MPDGRFEDFTHPNLGRVHRAAIQFHGVDHARAGIEQQQPEFLLFEDAHFVLHQAGGIFWTADSGFFFLEFCYQAFA